MTGLSAQMLKILFNFMKTQFSEKTRGRIRQINSDSSAIETNSEQKYYCSRKLNKTYYLKKELRTESVIFSNTKSSSIEYSRTTNRDDFTDKENKHR